MSRQFRAKRIGTNEWVYGSHYHAEISNQHFILNEPQEGVSDYINVIPETVGQFTGVFDNNNKEVYENDFLKVSMPESHFEEILQVIYDSGGFIFKGVHNILVGWAKVITTDFVIVGNIYDNPEIKTK